MKFQDTLHDPDSSKDVWDALYDVVYKDAFGDIFDFTNRCDKETSHKRWYIKIDRVKRQNEAEKYPKFKMAGDCIFNFNCKRDSIYKELIGPKNEELLRECHIRHHGLVNFAFMPITGGLNSTKGILRCVNGKEGKPFDRPDVLIAEITNYFEEKPSRIFRNSNANALEWYLLLPLFDNNTYKYCKVIYMMDKTMTDEFIDMASMPICDEESAVKYMNFAMKYWEMKDKVLSEYGIVER